MIRRQWFAVVAAGGLFLAGFDLFQAAESRFGALVSPTPEAARAQALDWLKSTGKTDAATLKAFDDIWKADRPLLDLVADTFSLGDPAAAKLLAEARDVDAPAPKEEVPAMLKDAKLPAYFRANLALAYARSLSGRRVYEESLDALRSIKPEQVIDPAAYFFHKAVAEHALLQKEEATRTIARLLDDVPDAPDRYRLVATLMFLDMQSWRSKDLGEIARKMDNIERRLELARGGPQTQKMQKEVVARLDELIKQLENQQKNQGQGQGQGGGPPNDGGCPPGGQQPGQPGNQAGQPTAPQQDSMGGQNSGPGRVDEKKLRELAEVWGKLPEKERERAMLELTRDLPPRYREVIESYFKKIADSSNRP